MLAYANRFFLYQNLNRPKTKVKLSRSIFEVHCSAQFWWDNKKWRQFRVRMSIGQHSSHFPLNFQSCKISQPSSTSSISAVKSVKWNIIIQPKISYLASSLGSATSGHTLNWVRTEGGDWFSENSYLQYFVRGGTICPFWLSRGTFFCRGSGPE